MTQSTEVTAKQQATAAQYNALRRDVLDSVLGHRHTGVAGGGFLLIGRGFMSARPTAGAHGRLYIATDIGIIFRDDITATIPWQASTAYALNSFVVPTTLNGFVYETTTAGTSAATEPVWPTTIGATITNGTVTWTCRAGWTEIARGETAIRLAQLAERAHGSLTGIGSDDHHPRGHDHSLAADGALLAVAAIPNLPAARITTGIFDNARINWASPGAIGTTTQPSGSFAQIVGGLNVVPLATPAAPTVTVIGTAGTTRYDYRITAQSHTGETLASAITSITTGNAILTATNFNRISWPAVSGARDYRVWRVHSAGTPATLGVIATVVGITVDDTGLAGGGQAIPLLDTSSSIAVSLGHGIGVDFTTVGGWHRPNLGIAFPHTATWGGLNFLSHVAGHVPQFVFRNAADNAVWMAIRWGNVGIGTAAPGTLLTLRRAAAGNVLAIRNIGDTADTFRITDTGIVNLGTWQGTPIAPAFVSFDFPRGLNPTTLVGTPRTRYVLPGWYFQDMGTVTVPRDLVYYTPIFVAETTVFDRIGIEVITGGGTGCIVELRVFSWIGSGIPGSQIAGFASVDAATAGVHELWVDFTLTRGYYFLAALPRLGTANPVLRGIAATSPVTTPVAGLGPIAPIAAPVVPGAASNIIYVHEWTGGVIPTTAQPPWQMRPINYAFVFVREHD